MLGLELQDWGGIVVRPEAMAAHPGAGTVFSPFEADTTYFAPREVSPDISAVGRRPPRDLRTDRHEPAVGE